MRIVLLVEGRTEKVFLPFLRDWLHPRLAGRMPKLVPRVYDGRIPTAEKLARVVHLALNDRREPADAVIALTDVYTGSREFLDAADARQKMRQWVGDEPRFHPHAAQYDFEAWLLPYWTVIQRLAGSNRAAPSGTPERVNHDRPPAHRIAEVFQTGSGSRQYSKPRDAPHILKDQDLLVAINACPELKALVNTILGLCGGGRLP